MAKNGDDKFSALRRRALEILDGRPRTDPGVQTSDLKRLIFELDTYRIELELQNEELRDAQEVLEHSRLKFNQLYEFAPVGYLTLSGTGHIVEANMRAAQMFGVDRGELIDRKITGRIYYDDQDIFHLHLQKLMETREKQTCGLRVTRKDNSLLHVQLESSLRPDTGVLWEQIFMTMADITELAQARQAIVDLNDDLERRVEEKIARLKEAEHQLLHSEKLAAIGTLAASIAHELNNPLQGVMNVIKGVGHRAVFEPEDSELMAIAVGECQRMRDLLRALQDFNRPSSGIRAPIDLHSTLDSILLLYGKTLALRNITLVRQYGHDIPVFYAVADQLKQVIINLLANAVDACAAGGRITVGTEANHGYVAFSIMDNGVGIDPSIKDRIFEPFFSTKSEVRGTGLGLSVSYGIIASHNGVIEVNSSPGEDTVFRVKLPLGETLSGLFPPRSLVPGRTTGSR